MDQHAVHDRLGEERRREAEQTQQGRGEEDLGQHGGVGAHQRQKPLE